MYIGAFTVLAESTGDFPWDTFWSATGAVATVIAIGAIIAAYRQLKFEAWNRCQEIFTENTFFENRKRLFERLQNQNRPWSRYDLRAAIQVTGKMDELCRLSRFFGKRQMIRVWGNPIAKSWAFTSGIVILERTRTHWDDKWNSFERLGTKSMSHLKSSVRIDCQCLGKNLDNLYRKKYGMPPT